MRGSALVLCLAALSACTSQPVERQARVNTNIDGPNAPLFAVAQRLADAGQHAAAIPLYRQAWSEGGQEKADVLAALARSFAAVGQYAKAEETLLLAAGKNSSSAAVQLGLGEVNLAFGRPQMALDNFDAALRFGGGAQAQSGRAVALDALGRHSDALAAHALAVRQGGDDVNMRSNLALSHALYGDHQAAIDLLKQVVADPKAQAQHRQNLVLAYVLAGDLEKAGEMARVDLDNQSASETLMFFRELAALPPSERVKVLILGAQAPERTLSDEGILSLMKPTTKKPLPSGW
ncbi:pilus assembly protein TadD [Kordiimonadales bacterium JCM 17843]|nr:pilus assembly protein TadD [Kordiimonadales bacterium JCM 17843]